MPKYDDSEIIINKLYPLVSKSLDKNHNNFVRCIGAFFNERAKLVHDIAPYVNILYNKSDEDKLFNSLGISYEQVLDILSETFFFKINYSPLCAKEPYVETLMCAIKYYMKKNDEKTAELVTLYTLFSGKFYASLYSNYFKYTPKKEIMDYVVNNMLTDKFDLKKEGTIFKAMRKLASTWINTYKSELKSSNSSDDEFGKRFIQQLRDRENSFLKNIANLYYKAAEEKLYMNYESDDTSEDNYRLIDNDSAKAYRITEATLNVLTSQKIDIKRCELCAKANGNGIKPEYIKNIMESIVSDKHNIPDLRRVINIIICDYLSKYPGTRIGSPDFIKESLKAQSNTTNKIYIEMKNIITKWLNEYSEKFRSCKRPATLNAFFKSILMYLVYTISYVANK